MDDYDIVILDDDDEMRNARDHRAQTGRGPGTIRARPAQLVRSRSGGSRAVVVGGGRAASRPGLAGLSVGQIIGAAAAVFAALQSLPAAPVATGKADTDAGNLILYQNALASHAKRDEQLRTLGSLVEKLVG